MAYTTQTLPLYLEVAKTRSQGALILLEKNKVTSLKII
jgi:hypothetical protein